MVAGAFIASLLLFVVIGALAITRRRNTPDDYLLASRGVSPWLTALSAVATNNSGYMFVGQIGATYTMGLSSIWLLVGWVAGDYLTWRFVHPRFRELSGAAGSRTFSGFIGSFYGARGRIVVLCAGLTALIFLSVYASAQLRAGGKALHSVFGWHESTGVILGALVVLIYSFAGGIRASIWTDAAQSMLMMGAMLVLACTALLEVGGLAALSERLGALGPTLNDVFPSQAPLAAVLFILGWFFAGLGTVGQPHVMVRLMAIDSAAGVRTARHIYFAFYTVFCTATIIVGLCARVLLDAPADFDPELALPALSFALLPEVMVGLILAGLFAAVMSTADSQVLVCAAALTQSIVPRWSESYRTIKLATAAVTCALIPIAMYGPSSVFTLATLAWSALASTLGPIVILYALGARPTRNTTLAIMGSGLSVAIAWRYGFGWSASVYEALPGMLTGFAAYALSRALPQGVPPQSTRERPVR